MNKDPVPASLFLFEDRIVWGSVSFSGGETCRPACVLLIGAFGPLSLTTGEGRPRKLRVVLVGPNVKRRIEARDAGFFSLSLDPAHPGYPYLCREVLRGRDTLDLSRHLNEPARRIVAGLIEQSRDCSACMRQSDGLLEHFFPEMTQAPPVDARVLGVAAYLRRTLPTRVNMQELGELCHLSAGRLTHLFSQELGVSIRTYLRWVKLCKAAELFSRKQSIAEVAAAIGFADSSHLIRVFRNYFSVKPTLIADRSRVHVQVGGSV